MIAAILESVPAMILLTGSLVALASGLLGCFLVVRGEAMAGDAIAHAIVLGIVLVWLATGALSGPLMVAGAALAGLGAVVGAQALARTRLMGGQAAVGLVFPAMFALGVLLINLNARNIHLDSDAVLLGEIGFVWLDTVPLAGFEVPVAVLTLAAASALNIAFVTAFWKELKLGAFDPGLAAALGFRPLLMSRLLLALCAVTAVAAFDAVGVVLFLAFLIVPAVTGRLVARSMAGVLGVALVSGQVAVGLGYLGAMRADLSIGAMMALATGAGLALALAASPRSGIVALFLRRRARGAEARVNTLLMHLHSHAGTAAQAEESTAQALVEHLRWSVATARAVILLALDRGLIARRGGIFELSETGRARAQALARRYDRRRALPPETADLPRAGGGEGG